MSEDENNSAEASEGIERETDAPATETSNDAERGELDALKMELEQALNEASTARDEMLRARAEADNVRKRAERDVAAAHKYGLERFLASLLPIKDSIDLGFDALDTATDINAIREGMVLTAKMFDDALEKAGVTAVKPLGEAFNPEFHQAMTMQPSVDQPPGTILAVMQPGYVLNDRLLRPAMVVVAKAPEDA